MFSMKNVILKNKMFRSLILASGLIFSAFSAQADLILTFDGDDIEVRLNEIFTVQLFADASADADSITFFDFDIEFDSSRLAYVDFTLGSLFDSGGSDFSGRFRLPPPPVQFPFASFPSFPPFPIGAVGPNILLGTFTFTALDYGQVLLNTKDENFQGVLGALGLEDDKSASSDISVVSAPATLGLFAIALVGLVSSRRKA
jgi:hypothetical protein